MLFDSDGCPDAPKTLLGPYVTSPAVWSPFMEKLVWLKWWVGKDCSSLQTASKAVSYSAPLWVLSSLHKTRNLTPQTLCFVTGLIVMIFIWSKAAHKEAVCSHTACVSGFLQKPAASLLMNRSGRFRRIQEQRDRIHRGHVRLCPSVPSLYTVFIHVSW